MDDSARTQKDIDPSVSAERPEPPVPGDIDDPAVEQVSAHRVFAANVFPTEATPVAIVLGEADEPTVDDERVDDSPEDWL